MKHLAALFAAMMVLVAVQRASAAPAPAEVRRVIRSFDFEERRLGNPEETPMHWTKVAGPGMPHYVRGKLSADVAHDGKYSFRMDLNGGSVAYRFDPGRILVTSGAHYKIDAWVRTTVMQNARARLTAYFADIDGRPVPGTIQHTEPYAATANDDGWRRIQLEMSAKDPRAASLVLEMGLLQPALYAGQTLGQRTLNAQDIQGTAWFDDIHISQVPRITMTTDRPGNVYRRGEAVRLTVQIDDRFTDDLSAQLTVADADGQRVFQRSGAAELGQAEQVAPGRKRLRIAVPELPAGLYRATLETSSQGQSLGSQQMAFIQLADAAPPGRPDGRFGFVATEMPLDAWEQLPAVLPLLSAGRVKLAVWGPQGDILETNAGKFDALLEKLGEMGITPTACLVDLPPSVTKRIVVENNAPVAVRASFDGVDPGLAVTGTGTSNWPLILRADPKLWQPQLAFLVSRHANHLDRWQLGSDGSDAFVTDPRMRKVYDIVYAEFRKLVQNPDLAMPWPAWQEMDGNLPSTVALTLPANIVLPHQVPLYIADVAGGNRSAVATQPANGRGPAHVSVSLGWLDGQRYGRTEKLRDLAQRVVHTLAADAGRIDLPLPMTVRRENGTLIQEPAEELIVLRTLIMTLGGASYRGKVPIAEGIEAFLFDRNGVGILALWDRGMQGGQRELALNLGSQPTMVDLWGNTTALHKLAGKEGKVSLTLGRMPVFLIDVDGQLAQMRASVALDRPLIESSFQPHVRKLKFTNAYKNAIGGTVRLRPPTGWQVSPPTFTFTLNPGEQFEKDVTIEIPYNSVAGIKSIDAQFNLQTDGGANFNVPISVNLGLSDVGMQTIALRDGNDVIVQQMITNYGDRPIDYTAFAVYPGQTRQERLINGLAAGKTTVKRYKFTDVEFRAGAKIRAGVKEMVGTRILNDEVAVQ